MQEKYEIIFKPRKYRFLGKESLSFLKLQFYTRFTAVTLNFLLLYETKMNIVWQKVW